MSRAQELMYYVLRVDFVVVDWYCGVCGGCCFGFLFFFSLGGRISTERGERKRERRNTKAFAMKKGSHT